MALSRPKGLPYRNLSYPTLIFIAALILISIAGKGTWAQAKQQGNPFSLPPGVHLLNKGSEGGPKESASTVEPLALDLLATPLKVKAILISNHIRMASIGQHIVKVGDSINDEKVLEITRDKVVLGKGNKKRTLLLEQSPVRITVEEN